MYFCRFISGQLKNNIKYILQRILGFHNYLLIFSNFKIATLRWDKKEGDFFHFLSLLEEEKGTVLDIGANIGIMTVHLSKKLPSTPIYAVEPMPDNLAVLRKIIHKRKLKNVTILPYAVGEKAGTLEMILPHSGKTKMQGLSHVKTPEIKDWNKGEEVKVEVKTLDGLFEGKKIQGIKIDVENYEFYALKGAKKILTEYRPIVYTELWDNENRQKCFDLMTELNYRIEVLVNKQLVAYNKEHHSHQNFFFLPN